MKTYAAMLSLGAMVYPVVSTADEVATYSRCSGEPVVPTFDLSTNSDSSTSIKGSLLVATDCIGEPFGAKTVHGLSLAPTVLVTQASKQSIFAVGSGIQQPDFGSTKFTAGLMLGYTLRNTEVTPDETSQWGKVQNIRQEAYEVCAKRCAPPGAEDADFCADSANGTDKNWQNWDYGRLCPEGQAKWKKDLDDQSHWAYWTKKEISRFQFPELDFSLWGGGGTSQFSYYGQAADGSYSSESTWQPNGAGALQVTWLVNPDTSGAIGWGLDFSLLGTFSYQSTKEVGAICDPLGSGASGGTLSKCSSSEAIGAPTFGSSLDLELHGDVYDHDNAYWRLSFGAGFHRNVILDQSSVSFSLPFYLNGMALGGDKSKNAPAGPIVVTYSGIVGITPTLEYVALGPSTGWAFVLAVDLLGQRNLFPRADTLSK